MRDLHRSHDRLTDMNMRFQYMRHNIKIAQITGTETFTEARTAEVDEDLEANDRRGWITLRGGVTKAVCAEVGAHLL
jgi:hypothetical protein